MSSNLIKQPYEMILDPTGGGGRAKPVANGKFYVGEIDKDPVANPLSDIVYMDESGQERALSSPIILNNSGAFVVSKNDGTIIQPYMKDSVGFSVLIQDARGRDVYSNLNTGDPGNLEPAIIEFLPKYTDVTYTASGGKSSVENMIAGIPIVATLGGYVSIGSTIFKIEASNKNGILLDSGLYANLISDAYAIDFAETVNESVALISGYFSERITIDLISGMKITDTVLYGLDCDIRSSYLVTDGDFDFIFQCKTGWNGTATPCVIDCKNNSHARGWDLTTNLPGTVLIDRNEFVDIGDEDEDTSAVRWVGFNIPNNGSKSITLINPTTKNSYVVPNGVIGDVAGSNRNVIITGKCSSGYTPTKIKVKGHTAIDLRTEEDSDSLVVEATSDDLTDIELNVDISGGYSNNCQKRMYKLQTQNPPINVRGVRLDIDGAYANAGASVKAVSPLDVQEGFSLEVNGTLIYEGNWTYGLRAKQSIVRGNLDLRSKASDDQFIDGNTTRAIYIDDGADVEIKSLSGFGHYETLRSESGTKLKIKAGVSFFNKGLLGNCFGELTCGPIDYVSSSQVDQSSSSGTLTLTGNVNITGKSKIDLTAQANPPRSGIRASGCPELYIDPIEVKGVATSTIELNNIPDATLIRPENKTTSHTVRLEGSNGNVFIDGGRNPTSITFQPSGTTSNLESVNERIY